MDGRIGIGWDAPSFLYYYLGDWIVFGGSNKRQKERVGVEIDIFLASKNIDEHDRRRFCVKISLVVPSLQVMSVRYLNCGAEAAIAR